MGVRLVPDLDYVRVYELLKLLRKRTREEVDIATLVFAPAFTPEMREALSYSS